MSNEDRQIVHMDLDTFFVSVERLLNSELNHRPVLIGGTSARGVVASCSYEARRFGVHSGMPMAVARQRCPSAVVIRGNSMNYSKYSNMVTSILKECVPVLEKTSIDEFYLDMTGMDRFHGTYKYVSELQSRVFRESGLPISFGISTNKTVSKVATGEGKPKGAMQVDGGVEKAFLAPLSIRKIPMIGLRTYQSLAQMGVVQIQTLQDMPVDVLQRVFGKSGKEMWKKANGIDPSPVTPFHERKSISTERTFDRDTIDLHKLNDLLVAMTENLAYQLRRGNKLTACVAVKIRYADFNTHSLQRHIPYTSADHQLLPVVRELFQKLYNRRVRVRLIGIRLSHLVGGGHQMNLFEDSEELIQLYQAMDRVRKRYGDRAILRASGMEARTIGRITNPFSGSAPELLANRRT